VRMLREERENRANREVPVRRARGGPAGESAMRRLVLALCATAGAACIGCGSVRGTDAPLMQKDEPARDVATDKPASK